MSRVNGQLVTCNRCGKTTFRQYTGEGVTDGGYTRWDKFEDFPEGWSNPSYIGDLCPECTKEWERITDNFKRRL